MRRGLACLASLILVCDVALGADHPAPVQHAVELLAEKLGVNPEAIEVISYERVEWPDSSLGVPGYGCLPVITPGYKVLLGHGGQRYEYHTDLDGRAVLVPAGPPPSYHCRSAGRASDC